MHRALPLGHLETLKVVEFEHNLPLGFDPRYPSTPEQARDFKNKLVNGILGTATVVRDQLDAKIELGRVLGGVVALLQEHWSNVSAGAPAIIGTSPNAAFWAMFAIGASVMWFRDRHRLT